jgi:transposase
MWAKVEPLILARKRIKGRKYRRKPGGGRKRLDARKVFEGIVHVLRAGCRWKALPEERFGSAGSIHRCFQQWERQGVFVRPWRKGLAEHDDLEGIAWTWQSIDGAMVKAPLAQEAVSPDPTDRGKKGSNHSLLVDERGIPRSIVAGGAQVHDVKLLEPTLDQTVATRPPPENPPRENLCLDAGYAGALARKAVDCRSEALRAACPPTRRRNCGKAAKARRESETAGCGKNPFMAEPLPQAAGAVRKNRTWFRGFAAVGMLFNRVSPRDCYSRISSKRHSGLTLMPGTWPPSLIQAELADEQTLAGAAQA